MPPKEKPKKPSEVAVVLRVSNGQIKSSLGIQFANIMDLSLAYTNLKILNQEILENIKNLSKGTKTKRD